MRKDKVSMLQSLTLLTQFGISMIVPILFCTLLGVWLGRRFDLPLLVIPLFFIGALAGARNVYIMAKKTYAEDGEREDDNAEKD